FVGEMCGVHRKRLGALAAVRPMGAVEGLDAMAVAVAPDHLDLGIGVADEMVDRHRDRHPELLHVVDMAAEIGEALLQGFDILLLEVVLGHTAVSLLRSYAWRD